MTSFETFTLQNARADLDFTVDKPSDWITLPLPEESHDFSDVRQFAPIAILMTPYAPVVFSVAARPGYADGTVAQWLQHVARERGLDPGTLEQQQLGPHAGVGCWGAQIESGIVMRARLVFVEDGDRLVNVSCMAPETLWATFAPVFLRMLRTFTLTKARGATVQIAAADAPLAPDSMLPPPPAAPAAPTRGPLPLPDEASLDAGDGEDAEAEIGTPAAAVALAQDMQSFEPEHAMNVRLRDAGAGLVPNVLDYHEQELWATLAPGALRATLRVPFGWHVIDDGKRALVFDATGNTQVSLQLFPRQRRTDDAILAAKVPELQREWPAMRHLRTEVQGLQCLLVRDAQVDGKPIEQAYVLREAFDDLVLQARVTSSPEHFAKACDLLEVLLRNLEFAGAPA